jgi:hypothetical protein
MMLRTHRQHSVGLSKRSGSRLREFVSFCHALSSVTRPAGLQNVVVRRVTSRPPSAYVRSFVVTFVAVGGIIETDDSGILPPRQVAHPQLALRFAMLE